MSSRTKRLVVVCCAQLVMIAPVSAQSFLPEVVAGQWDFNMFGAQVNRTCMYTVRPFPGGPISRIDPVFQPSGSAYSMVGLEGSDVTLGPSEDADEPQTLPGTFTGSTLSGSVNYTLGISGFLCNASAEFSWDDLQRVNGSDYDLSATARFKFTLNDCNGNLADTNASFINFPCVSEVSYPASRSATPPTGGGNLTLRAKIADSKLVCTLKSDGVGVGGVEVFADRKPAKQFKQLGRKITNQKGIARFNVQKVKTGVKLRCRYGTLLSRAVKR